MDLNQVETDFVLVLDDYHTIGAQDIHFLLGELLHHPHRSMHLVIATRHDPPLPLSPLRARNQLIELRAQDLRFSVEEIAVFMQQTLGSSLEDKTISILEEGTEGWPAGLRLASLSLRHSRDLDKSLAGLQGH